MIRRITLGLVGIIFAGLGAVHMIATAVATPVAGPVPIILCEDEPVAQPTSERKTERAPPRDDRVTVAKCDADGPRALGALALSNDLATSLLYGYDGTHQFVRIANASGEPYRQGEVPWAERLASTRVAAKTSTGL